MTFAVVGCGSIGQRHIRNLIALGIAPSDICALDVDPWANGSLPDGVVFTHAVGAYYMPVVDAALICVPAHYHGIEIRQWRERAGTLFIEKPAAVSVADLSPAEWAAGPSFVACNLRFSPDIAALLWWAKQQRQVRSEWLVQTNMASWPGTSYASDLIECGAHEFDLACQCLTGPVTVTFVEHKFDRWIVELADEHDSTARVVIDAYHKGASHRSGQVQSSTGASMRYDWAHTPDDVNTMYVRQMEHFLRVVRGEVASMNPLAKAKQVVQICEDVARIAREAAA